MPPASLISLVASVTPAPIVLPAETKAPVCAATTPILAVSASCAAADPIRAPTPNASTAVLNNIPITVEPSPSCLLLCYTVVRQPYHQLGVAGDFCQAL